MFLQSVAILSLISLSRTTIAGPLDNEIDTGTSSDLSHLGPAIFGSPQAANKLEKWNENSPENPEEMGEYAEGDILFPEKARNGLVAQTARWKDGIVPYEIAGSYSSNDLKVIQRAMDIYHKYTCIKFRQRQPSDADYLSIVSGNSGCWSSVGRVTGRQEVNLQAPACTTKVGTPLHELMHAVGFLHEQNRWERDDYVSIEWQNIKSGHDQNFKKADKDTTDGYGVPYDYRSVMHYSPYAFSTNGQATIVPKDSTKNMKMGQRDGFSKGDILKINGMYGCTNKLPGSIEEHADKNTITDVNNNNNQGKPGGLLGFLFQIVS